ncbi:MAG TPA: DUF6134 family protein [Stellaceae bacterium]|nr:DUF6134 family protein [Stellaceae bacterium]
MAVLWLALAGSALADPPPDPFKLYGGDIVFSVWRKGDEIGEHRVTFAHQDGGFTVRSTLKLAVKFLGIVVYRFNYESNEVWRDGMLASLDASQDDNGTVSKVTARRTGDTLDVTGPKGHETVTGAILPSTHWNPQTIAADQLLNTLDGTISKVKLMSQGTESVPVGAGRVQATHYLYTGDIKAESWYDAAGHWVKLRFPGKDGSEIDYVCVACGAKP